MLSQEEYVSLHGIVEQSMSENASFLLFLPPHPYLPESELAQSQITSPVIIYLNSNLFLFKKKESEHEKRLLLPLAMRLADSNICKQMLKRWSFSLVFWSSRAAFWLCHTPTSTVGRGGMRVFSF